MKTMFKVKVCLLMLLCSVAAAMANPLCLLKGERYD